MNLFFPRDSLSNFFPWRSTSKIFFLNFLDGNFLDGLVTCQGHTELKPQNDREGFVLKIYIPTGQKIKYSLRVLLIPYI